MSIKLTKAQENVLRFIDEMQCEERNVYRFHKGGQFTNILDRLEKMGLIQQEMGTRQRIQYTLTDAGNAWLNENDNKNHVEPTPEERAAMRARYQALKAAEAAVATPVPAIEESTPPAQPAPTCRVCKTALINVKNDLWRCEKDGCELKGFPLQVRLISAIEESTPAPKSKAFELLLAGDWQGANRIFREHNKKAALAVGGWFAEIMAPELAWLEFMESEH